MLLEMLTYHFHVLIRNNNVFFAGIPAAMGNGAAEGLLSLEHFYSSGAMASKSTGFNNLYLLV